MWPENWAAVQTFRRCATQWRRAGLEARPTGLDYAVVLALLDKVFRVADLDDGLARVQIMEDEALALFKLRRARN